MEARIKIFEARIYQTKVWSKGSSPKSLLQYWNPQINVPSQRAKDETLLRGQSSNGYISQTIHPRIPGMAGLSKGPGRDHDEPDR